jgi:hypothetical protein
MDALNAMGEYISKPKADSTANVADLAADDVHEEAADAEPIICAHCGEEIYWSENRNGQRGGDMYHVACWNEVDFDELHEREARRIEAQQPGTPETAREGAVSDAPRGLAHMPSGTKYADMAYEEAVVEQKREIDSLRAQLAAVTRDRDSAVAALERIAGVIGYSFKSPQQIAKDALAALKKTDSK